MPHVPNRSNYMCSMSGCAELSRAFDLFLMSGSNANDLAALIWNFRGDRWITCEVVNTSGSTYY